MWSSRYSCHVLTSMMSALSPPSSRRFSSSAPMKLTGASGGAAGAAPRRRRAEAPTVMSEQRTSASDDPRPAAHGRASVSGLLGLHRLALAAGWGGGEHEVVADRVDGHA